MIERAAAARAAGLDSLFVGDHHSNSAPYFQNVPMIGRLLAEWGDATAGCLFLLPLWNPVLVAEQVGTLAAIAEGPFVVQVGLGYGNEAFAAMGASTRTRPSAFEESLDIVRRLSAGEVVSSSGRFRFDGAVVNPRPPDGVTFWVSSMSEPSIDRSARLADGWLAAPAATVADAAVFGQRYRQRCAELGKAAGVVAIRRDIYVAGTDDEADEVLRATQTHGYRGFDPSVLECGTVEHVIEAFRALEADGFTDVIIRHLVDDQPRVLASYRRLREVRAAFG